MQSATKFRTILGLLLAAAIFVVIGVGVVWGAQRQIVDATWVAHSNEVIGQISQIEARVRDAEAAQRGYLLTGIPGYLAEYAGAVEALPPLQGRLVALVADNASQTQHAKALIGLITVRLGQLTETLERYRVGGLASARSNIGRDNLVVSTAIRREAVEMSARESVLLQQRAASTDTSALVLRVLAMLGIPTGLITIFVVYTMLAREIRQRSRAEDKAAEANAELRTGVERLERNGEDLRALSRYGSMLQSCKVPEEAFELTMRMLKALLPGTAGTVYRMRNSQDHAEARVSWGQHYTDCSHAAGSDIGCVESVSPDACWALRRGQPYLVGSTRDAVCTHAGALQHDRVGTACIPLSAQGVQLGLLYLSADDAGFLKRIDIIEAVAEQLSMALSNLYLQERLRLQSIREPLTGLFNRRYLEESATREFARCERRQQPVSLLMLDIDHFKAFNDVHGHAGGDLVLSEFGKLLQGQSRTEDIACRYGGEEFTLIMPEATLETAIERAESIRAAVEAMRVSHQGGKLPPLTVSIGIATFPGDGFTPEAVLHAADEALYRAKRAGRNRVETTILSVVPIAASVLEPASI